VVHQPVRIVSMNSQGNPSCSISQAGGVSLYRSTAAFVLLHFMQALGDSVRPLSVQVAVRR